MKIRIILIVIIYLINIGEINAQEIKKTTGIGIGYTHMSSTSKGGLYFNIFDTNLNDWGYLSNLDFYFVNGSTFTFIDFCGIYTLVNQEIKFFPYAGLSLAFYNDSQDGNAPYPHDFVEIDAFKAGLSLGAGGAYVFDNFILSFIVGHYTVINTSMIRFSIGFKL